MQMCSNPLIFKARKALPGLAGKGQSGAGGANFRGKASAGRDLFLNRIRNCYIFATKFDVANLRELYRQSGEI